MTEAEARKHLLNFKCPTHIADEARAVLAPIEKAELVRRAQAVEQDAAAESTPPEPVGDSTDDFFYQ